jgi:hypothetical protein
MLHPGPMTRNPEPAVNYAGLRVWMIFMLGRSSTMPSADARQTGGGAGRNPSAIT